MIHVTYYSNKKKNNITLSDDSTGFKSTYSWDPTREPMFGKIMDKYVEFMNRESIVLKHVSEINLAIDIFLADPLYVDNFDEDCNPR